jgi:hypothetical protein
VLVEAFAELIDETNHACRPVYGDRLQGWSSSAP